MQKSLISPHTIDDHFLLCTKLNINDSFSESLYPMQGKNHINKTVVPFETRIQQLQQNP